MPKLSKRPEGDGTFTLLDGKGTPLAVGLSEGDIDARIASAAGDTGPADGSAQTAASDPGGARDGGTDAKAGRKAARDES